MAYQPPAEGKLYVKKGSGARKRLLNVTAFSLSGGDRPENTNETLDEGSVVTIGDPTPKDVSVSLQANPASEGYRMAFDAYTDKDKLVLEYEVDRKSILDNATSSNTLAIAAATGALTASAGVKMEENTAFLVGRGIVIGNVLFVIEEITSNTAGVVSRADGMAIAAVATTDDWEIVEFGVKYSFEVEVLSAGNVDLSPGAAFSDSLTLKSTAVLGQPTFLIT